MRKILTTLLIVIAVVATMSILWIFGGREFSLFVDRFKTAQISSTPISSLTYEGTGTGGTIVVNDLRLDLAPANPQTAPPHIGTTKDGELALSLNGKVFAFSQVPETTGGNDEVFAAKPKPDDQASITIRHSLIGWSEPFKMNFMTGQTASRKRNIYYEFAWKKSSGAKLEMLWRYEQYSFADSGWGSGFMTREGETGLIRVEISGATH
ncbi:MAG: hypothetical protein ABI925_05830 [Verrucomicrobiota bacterium]